MYYHITHLYAFVKSNISGCSLIQLMLRDSGLWGMLTSLFEKNIKLKYVKVYIDKLIMLVTILS